MNPVWWILIILYLIFYLITLRDTFRKKKKGLFGYFVYESDLTFNFKEEREDILNPIDRLGVTDEKISLTAASIYEFFMTFWLIIGLLALCIYIIYFWAAYYPTILARKLRRYWGDQLANIIINS